MSVERRDCVKLVETTTQLPKGRRRSHEKLKPFEISKWDVKTAFEKVKANKGGAGVDGATIEDFEKDLKNKGKAFNSNKSSCLPPQKVSKHSDSS